MNRPQKILFLTPYPHDTAGSQRFRFEQYYGLLSDAGFEFKSQSFMDNRTWSILYKEGYTLWKIWGIIKGFVRRFSMLFYIRPYDFVFIHREITPIGFPVFEYLLSKVFRKKLIYDFDDAIWIPNTSIENKLVDWLKFPSKVKSIIKWSYKVSAGNQFLADFASCYNPNVIINPTTIDTEKRHIAVSSAKKRITIGWTGTHSTLKYLEILRKTIQDLSESYDLRLIVIADKTPEKPFPNQEFIYWNKKSEIDDLNEIDIGLMPLEDDKWSKGKCGFKALQFMALEKPVLVSPVGVNREIVEQNVHGYHCSTQEDWITKLKLLIEDEQLRKRLGVEGRKKVIDQFSIGSNHENFLRLFK